MYPKLDLPTIPYDLDMRLQSQSELERVHDESEDASYFYPVAHSAITSKAQECLDSPGLVIATDLGVAAFEAVGYSIYPNRSYDSMNERIVAAVSAELFVGRVSKPELYLQATEQALERMRSDTPKLTEVLTEIISRYVRHDQVSLRFALQGAAAIRGMQIFVDRKLETIS